MPRKRAVEVDAEPTSLRRSARTRSRLEPLPEPEPESQPQSSTMAKKAKTATTAASSAENTTSRDTAPRNSRRSARQTTEAGPSTQAPAATRRSGRNAAKKTGKGKAPIKVPVKEEDAEMSGLLEDDALPVAVSEVDETTRQYWLLKAEPESRFENGVDVRFSIDDLAACTAPEPWDGIRNYAARNNLRKMKKGDLAFFYHSNTKEPGIVGTMAIVQEHSPDLTAHDPNTAYYDPNAAADAAAGKEPKWSVVHVEFRSKFANPITLRDLKSMGGPGQPLGGMQMLKQSRLSVSRVSAAEWEHLMAVASAS
ncbi:hypothetical protein SEPCBS57363_006488 [Sporothrix epigloea]|uniref:EVE domain-containing protein n=1 Tax=Sporothrix epigloea TaxID=1892477 RepID=A0ABP0E586_9PEZI